MMKFPIDEKIKAMFQSTSQIIIYQLQDNRYNYHYHYKIINDYTVIIIIIIIIHVIL